MDEAGLSENTIIAFTSDDGDYMGDHWMGDKDFYHEMAVKVPLIIADPRPEADATRGVVSDALVEMIDLAPTFMNALGCAPKPHFTKRTLATVQKIGKVGFFLPFSASRHHGGSTEISPTRTVRSRLWSISDARRCSITKADIEPVVQHFGCSEVCYAG